MDDLVIGAAVAQGIAVGEFEELLLGAPGGLLNVHSSVFPQGEIRGQVQ
jgi:hypothetical protein